MVLEFALNEEVIVAIVLGLVIPAIVIGVKTFFSTKDNHICIQRLEKKMDDMKMNFKAEFIEEARANTEIQGELKALGVAISVISDKVGTSERVHNELKDADREQKNFFADWIQRVEDVVYGRISSTTAIPKGTTVETTNSKLDEVVKLLNKIIEKDKPI